MACFMHLFSLTDQGESEGHLMDENVDANMKYYLKW